MRQQCLRNQAKKKTRPLNKDLVYINGGWMHVIVSMGLLGVKIKAIKWNEVVGNNNLLSFFHFSLN